MSNNLDFFGGQVSGLGSPTAVPTPAAADQRFGLGLPATGGQPAVALATSVRPRVSKRTVILLVVVILAGLLGGGYYVLRRPHAVPLPDVLSGLQRQAIHDGSEAAQLKTAKSRFAGLGIHDVSVGLYSDGSGGRSALFVVAGRGSASANFTQELAAVSGQSVLPGVTVNPVTASGLTLECVTVTQAGGSGAFCVWQGTGAVLFAFGSGLTAQEVGDDLAEVRTADTLA
jgi:hypothetical protein